MSAFRQPYCETKRERMRSRFRIAALALAAGLLLGSCGYDAGRGIADLPASTGWEALPIGSWVLNDGLDARAVVFCPRMTCPKPGVAALLAFAGEAGRGMEQALSQSPAALAGAFEKLASDKAAALAEQRRRAGRKPEPRTRSGRTDIDRFEADQAQGVQVTLHAAGTSRRQAVTAILYGRQDDRLLVALGISDEPDAARQQALAAWRSR